jgi:(p)ppGpp synthase/HD superfamily hydrolase
MGLNEFVTGKELADKAKEFATSKHEGQFRKFSKDKYINHPAAVAKTVEDVGGTPEMIAAAWLHDVVEDCDVAITEIESEFGPKVAKLVGEVTNPPDIKKIGKSKYIADKMNTMSSEALTIKLSDRLNNVSDFGIAHPEFVAKYAPETKFILDSLEAGGRPLNAAQKKLIDGIRGAIKL